MMRDFLGSSMDLSDILAGLNAGQREAVATPAKQVRVIAGAGSGKTRVLVSRMLFLLTALEVEPQALLALTFTNKAAKEIKERLEHALAQPLTGLWIGTFHSICLRILRVYAPKMGWPVNFVVMDSDDQTRLIKKLMRELNWQDERLTPKQLANRINAFKEKGARAADIPVKPYPLDNAIRELYTLYEARCLAQGTMDFAELLLLSVELLSQDAAVRAYWQQRFHTVLIDEFQDTNALQFRLLQLLCAGGAGIFAVGDDDQSIYAWRGARVEYMLRLEEQFPQLTTIRLEQNYRSTQTILTAANALIAHNQDRLGKQLWTEAEKGEPIEVYAALNGHDEAEMVVNAIKRFEEEGGNYPECAILYRSNAQSRVFEQALRQAQIPYQVYGGMRFFERAEIKEALAYLRLMHFPDDDAAVERVINVPSRKIGERSVAMLRELARRENTSLWQVLSNAPLLEVFSARQRHALAEFVALIDRLRQQMTLQQHVYEALKIIFEQTGLYALYQEGKSADESRVENLDELLSAASFFDTQAVGDIEERILAFVADSALDAGDRQQHTSKQTSENAVQLMTVHSAKGLEFERVFLVGMEEGLFPSQRAMDERQGLEEERRLAYVGMTRAMRKLTLSYAHNRCLQGRELYSSPSRFLSELPAGTWRPVHFAKKHYAAETPFLPHQPTIASSSEQGFGLGQMVYHEKFGEGCILSLEGSDAHRRALVRFSAGEKWLILAYAKLKAL